MRKSTSPSSRNGVISAEEVGGQAGSSLENAPVPAGAESGSWGETEFRRKGDTNTSVGPYLPTNRQADDVYACAKYHDISAEGDEGVACVDAAACIGEAIRNAAGTKDDATTKTAKAVSERRRKQFDKQEPHRQDRLQHLGLLLARKRQFAASRQVHA